MDCLIIAWVPLQDFKGILILDQFFLKYEGGAPQKNLPLKSLVSVVLFKKIVRKN